MAGRRLPAMNGRQVIRVLMRAVMSEDKLRSKEPTVLDAVALLDAMASEGLARGQVGTVVEELDQDTVLVEFANDQGRAYAIVPCPRANLLVLHYVPQAA